MRTKIFFILIAIFSISMTANAQEKKLRGVPLDSVPEGAMLVDKAYMNFRDKSHPGRHSGEFVDGKYVENSQFNYTGFYGSVKGGFSPDNSGLGTLAVGYEWNFGRVELEGSLERMTFDEISVNAPGTSVNFILDLNKSKLFNAYIGVRGGYIGFKSEKNVEGYTKPFSVEANSIKYGALVGIQVRVSKSVAIDLGATYDNFKVVKFGEDVQKHKINVNLGVVWRFGRR